MSGPKVIRIVTREERMAPSLRLLGALRNALSRWELEAAGSFPAGEPLATRARAEALAQAVQKADDFARLERSVAAELEFVQSLREEIVAERAERLFQARIRRYPDDFMGRHLAEQEALQKRLHDARPEAAPLTDEQRAILDSLRPSVADGSGADGVETWRADSAAPRRATLLERTLSELEALHPEAAAGFSERLSAISGEPPDRRDLLRDGLLLELSAAVKGRRGLAAAAEGLEDLASLRDLGPEAAAAVEAAVESGSLEAIRRTRLEIEAALKEAEEREFAACRRKAVLEGLSELGYAPGEEMATVVEAGGRPVVLAGAGGAYGLEITRLSSPVSQVRVVSFSGETDAAADLKAEERWCGQLARLRERAGRTGSEITVQKATPAGAEAVKKVARFQARTSRTPSGEADRAGGADRRSGTRSG